MWVRHISLLLTLCAICYEIIGLKFCKFTSIRRRHCDLALSNRDEIVHGIKSLRASQIKSILIGANVNVRALFDRHDLENALMELEMKWIESQPPVSHISIQTMGEGSATFTGIKLNIKGVNCRFMVDTGASMNLIRPEIAKRMGFAQTQSPSFTTGLGGTKSISSASISLENIEIDGKSVTFDAALVEDSKMLPPGVDGLLGLTFLSALGGAVEFNLENNILRFGTSKSLLSFSERFRFVSIPLVRVPTGLYVCSITVRGTPFAERAVVCSAMIDSGSKYTIFNSKAVEALGARMDDLPPSPVVVVGIDGRPSNLRVLSLQEIELGSGGDRGGDIIRVDRIDAFAADIPGLHQIGLGHVPAAILGMDVLGCYKRFVLDIGGSSLLIEQKVIKMDVFRRRPIWAACCGIYISTRMTKIISMNRRQYALEKK